MKILLAAVNAKYIHSNLAVYCLKASAGRYTPQIKLAEYTINHQTDDIFQAICREKPDLLFFSCYIWNRQIILETAENIRKVLPDTVIWAGGPEVSYDAERFLSAYGMFDGVMRGEGERTFRKVLEHYVDKSIMLEEIPGITYRECSGKICSNADVMPMQTLDEIPFVYEDIEQFENRIIYYESSRGCPFSCSYCLSSIDKSVRFRNLDLVKKELKFFLEHNVPQVKFVDRTFNCRHSHAQEIWRFIRDNDNGITNFHFEIAADLLNEEELELLSQMRPGLVQLEIGVQTVNERTLEAIHRMAKFEHITERVQKVAAHRNIHQHLDLIAGLPYEDYESFCHSFNEVYRQRPQELQLGFLKVLKGSEMDLKSEEYGIVYRSLPPYEVLETKWITWEELLRLKAVEEMLEVYYNSQQFRYTLQALVQEFATPFELYASLADYYEKSGLNGKSWSRMQRFQWLRAFIRETLDGRIAEEEDYLRYDELLTLDYYLRENGKTRPAWAEDQTEWKNWITDFYRQEEKEHRFLAADGEWTWKQMMRMTHLEHFRYDVTGNGERKEQWMLFDYSRRDPLTYDAIVFPSVNVCE